jgi:hypothetical protein
MIRLDSNKIKCPIEALNGFDYSRLVHTPEYNSNGETLTDVWKTKGKVDLGIKSISINKKEDTFILETSAKALRGNYIEGININTLDQFIDKVNEANILDINKDRFYKYSQILSADVTDNIKIDDPSIYNKLLRIPLPNKYEVTGYSTAKNEGVVFKGKQKSFKERQIFYNKFIELYTPKNKDIRAIINASDLEKQFKDIVRVEGNLTQLSKIREYASTDNTLKSVLSSDQKINYKLFSKITKQADVQLITLFNEYEGMKFTEIEKHIGMVGIIDKCHYEWQYIEQFLRVHNPLNYRRVRPNYKKLYASLISKKNKIDLSVVDMFKQLLMEAA